MKIRNLSSSGLWELVLEWYVVLDKEQHEPTQESLPFSSGLRIKIRAVVTIYGCRILAFLSIIRMEFSVTSELD